MKTFLQKVKTGLRENAFFLLLLPLFFIYSGYNELFGFLSAGLVLANLFFLLVAIAFIYLIGILIFRNKTKASVFTFFITLLFLVFGYLQDVMKGSLLPSFINKYSFQLPAVFAILIALLIYVKKSRSNFRELFNFLNLLFIILLLSEVPNSIRRYRLDKSVHNLIDFRFNALNEYQPSANVPDSLKPDIYFLVFDAMGSSKSIKNGLNKDNSQFDSFLHQKGFYIAANARSNYNWTIHSLSSTLNMDYLPSWIAPVMNDPKVYFWGSSSILDNSLIEILKKEGYQTHSYQQISFGNKDWHGKTYFDDLKTYHYSFKTLPGRIYRDLFWNYLKINAAFIHKKQITSITERGQVKKDYFDTTKSLIKQACSLGGKPKFVYGHFMVPHEPYVFDSTGNIKPAEQMLKENAKTSDEAYYEHLLFARKTIEELVTYIQLHSKKNTVIIVEGDHGYRTEKGNVTGYSFQNFSSFYFPDHNYELLYDSITPVNTFRVVLNKYFNTNLHLLKDTSILVTPQKETIRKSEKIQPTHTPLTPNQ